MALRCVIFDMDGTIGETLPLCIAAFRESIEPLARRTLSDGEIIATFGPSEEGTIAALAADHYQEGMERYIQRYEALHGICPAPFPEIPPLMEELRQRGILIALVTGKGPRSLPITLRQFGMEHAFDAVETGRREGPSKPRGICRVLERLQLQPHEALYVGDAPSDVTAAREVGVPIAAAAWSDMADREALAQQHPDALCITVEDLRSYLGNL